MDTTYWGRDFGVVVFKDAHTKEILWYKFVKYETLSDYKEGIISLEKAGFTVLGFVCDGFKGLLNISPKYKVQLCQFHQVKTILRYITRNPKTEAGIELKALILTLTRTDKESFIGAFGEWVVKWDIYLKERYEDPVTGKSRYVHSKLRSAYLSIKRNLNWLWTFYDYPALNIPNTNNAMEGYFTSLKSKLRAHNGLSGSNRERFIIEFFKGIKQ